MSGYILVFVSLTLRPVRLFGSESKKNGLRVEYVSGNTASVSNHFRGSEQSYPCSEQSQIYKHSILQNTGTHAWLFSTFNDNK